MSRRPQSFAAYLRRRWRMVGLLVVLLLGALLVAALTDRGHDPLWSARDAHPVAVALSPDGSVAYTLRGSAERVDALEAWRAETGARLWSSHMDDPRALLHAGDGWVAVATDFPRAFLTVYEQDGSVRWQVPLEGNPRAITGEGARVALALQAPGNPVLVYEGGPEARVLRFESFVNALDARGGHLAVGTARGEVVVFDAEGDEALRATLPANVRSLRLSGDGTRLIVGGFSATPGDLSGSISYFDMGLENPLRWTSPTRVGVGRVDLDAAGLWGVAVEETPPGNRVHGFATAHRTPLWTYEAGGEIAQDDSGSQGGIALSPDGRVCAVGTLRGDILALDMRTGRPLWSYATDGALAIAFPDDASGRVAASARVAPTAPFDSLLLFDTHEEPWMDRLGVTALILTGVFVGLGAAALGAGYARLRRA